jgi:hypothetical protein
MKEDMFPIKTRPVPANTMLRTYSRNGAYVDCFFTEISGQVSFGDYMLAFYTTPLFRLERLILTWVVSKPSTDKQVRQLADGEVEQFAAWRVEGRSENEILLCDFVGRTRSWLMTVPTNTTNDTRTQLYFGSAVVPKLNPKTGKQSLEFQYRALLGFHKIYSVLLLYSAKLRLQQRIGNPNGKQGLFH